MTEKKPVKSEIIAGKYFEAVGRRKTAVARVRLFDNKKKHISINGREFEQYFTVAIDRKKIEDPLKAAGYADASFSVVVKGGGVHSQAEAVLHGVARALIKMDKELRATLKPFGFMTRDPRAKERKKPGLRRARRAPQWQKR
ncbi:MAG: 30S ribosomal protein S9 [Patescibacteria group bacterium]|jgi:small subunit ribosomal protein S9